jgi:hypothetical protein
VWAWMGFWDGMLVKIAVEVAAGGDARGTCWTGGRGSGEALGALCWVGMLVKVAVGDAAGGDASGTCCTVGGGSGEALGALCWVGMLVKIAVGDAAGGDARGTCWTVGGGSGEALGALCWVGMPVKTADGAGDADGGGEYAQPPTWSTLVEGAATCPTPTRAWTARRPTSDPVENVSVAPGASIETW